MCMKISSQDFQSGFTLTPAHFLTKNLKPMVILDSEIDYTPTEDSIKSLLNNWEKGQKQLNVFWEIWKTEYLTSLCETSPHHKSIKDRYWVPLRLEKLFSLKKIMFHEECGKWKKSLSWSREMMVIFTQLEFTCQVVNSIIELQTM